MNPSELVDVRQGSDSQSVENRGAAYFLHEACWRCDFNEIRRLLQNRHDPNTLNENGYSPLHLVLIDEFNGEISKSARLECVKALVEYKCEVNIKDANGETPLCLAVYYKLGNCAVYLVRNGADTSVRFDGCHGLASMIASTMPEVMKEMLDASITLEHDDVGGGRQLVQLNWSPLLQYSDPNRQVEKKSGKQLETSFLHELLEIPETNTRAEYLKHPLVASFIHLKMKKIKIFSFVSGLLWFLRTILYCWAVSKMYNSNCHPPKLDEVEVVDDGSTSSTPTSEEDVCENTVGVLLLSITMMLFVILHLFLEVLWIRRVGFRHSSMTSGRAWAARIFIVVIVFTGWPGLQVGIVERKAWTYALASLGFGFVCAARTVMSSWGPREGPLLVKMFAEILKSTFRIFFFFWPLLTAFILGFKILLFETAMNEGISSVLMMVLGGSTNFSLLREQYESSKDYGLWLSVPTILCIIAFIVVISVGFVNFMIAVSVNVVQNLGDYTDAFVASNRIEEMFNADIYSSRYYLVPETDVQKKNWFLRFTRMDDVLPEKIRHEIWLFINDKYATKGRANSGNVENLSTRENDGETLKFAVEKMESKINLLIGKIHELETQLVNGFNQNQSEV